MGVTAFLVSCSSVSRIYDVARTAYLVAALEAVALGRPLGHIRDSRSNAHEEVARGVVAVQREVEVVRDRRVVKV